MDGTAAACRKKRSVSGYLCQRKLRDPSAGGGGLHRPAAFSLGGRHAASRRRSAKYAAQQMGLHRPSGQRKGGENHGSGSFRQRFPRGLFGGSGNGAEGNGGCVARSAFCGHGIPRCVFRGDFSWKVDGGPRQEAQKAQKRPGDHQPGGAFPRGLCGAFLPWYRCVRGDPQAGSARCYQGLYQGALCQERHPLCARHPVGSSEQIYWPPRG